MCEAEFFTFSIRVTVPSDAKNLLGRFFFVRRFSFQFVQNQLRILTKKVFFTLIVTYLV